MFPCLDEWLCAFRHLPQELPTSEGAIWAVPHFHSCPWRGRCTAPHPRHRSDSTVPALGSPLPFFPSLREDDSLTLEASGPHCAASLGPETQSHPRRVHLSLSLATSVPEELCAGLHTRSDHLCISRGSTTPFLGDKEGGSRGVESVRIILPKYVQVLFLSTWECDL